MKKIMSIAMAFVGLVVGAGFATGSEIIQYFISFGTIGLVGVVIAGIVMTVSGAVVLQIGSYFLAEEHGFVFKKIAHPIVSRILDFSVTFTLFCVGSVMLAGAGANLSQQFGFQAWIGSVVMTALVLAAGMLDVDRVSQIIAGLTPLVIVAIGVVFVFTLFNMPADMSVLDGIAQQQDSPVRPFWLSALNYCGMNLLVAISMALVIGGSNISPRQAGWGGMTGGLIYTILLALSAVTLYFSVDVVGDQDVPVLGLMDQIHPAMGVAMAFIIFAMVFNTAIGMFYALGRRAAVISPRFTFRPTFIIGTLAGFAVSFIGFESLLANVYPIIGYLGIFMFLVLVSWRIKRRARVMRETRRRERIGELVEENDFQVGDRSSQEAQELFAQMEASDADTQRLSEVVRAEIKNDSEQ